MASASAAPELLALVAGTAHYPKSNGELPDLEAVETEVALVRDVLETQYHASLLDGGLDRDSASLLQAILDVLKEEAGQDEAGLPPLVVYLSGHGLEGAADYYLGTYDTDPSPVWLPRTSVPMTQLAEILEVGAGREIVVVIDACQAELGIEHIATFSLGNKASSGRNGKVWGVAAASRVEEAEQLEFATAFANALRKPQVRRSQRFLQIGELVEQINRDRGKELARWIPGTSSTGTSRVFRNPFFEGQLPLVPERALRLYGGRQRARRELLDFTRDQDTGRRAVMVVSGAPGSGKSMMLSVLKKDLDAVGTKNVVLDGRGRGAKDMIWDLFEQLGLSIPTAPDGIAVLQDYPSEVVVLVDAPESMDEDDRDSFIADVLHPLAESPGGMKLVVGSATMPELLRGVADQIDLDSDSYFVADDVIDLAVKVLTSDDSRLADGDDAEVRRLARGIGAKAGRSFLTAHSLALWGAEYPYTKEEDMPILADRLALRLKALNLDPVRTMGLLAPLAFAEGPGVPDFGLWLEVAKRSTRVDDYTSAELVALLDTLDGDLVTEAFAEPEQACWRLASDDLAEELRRGRDAAVMHAAFADTLLAAVPQLPSGTRQWELVTEYTRRHLAMHAARAGRLAELLDHPGFLLVTDPARTKRALYLEDSRTTQRGATLSRSTVVRRLLEALTPADRANDADRAAQLAYLAHVAGLDRLAGRADRLPASWRTVWAAQADAPTATTLAAHVVGNAELLVIGGDDGSVNFHRVGGETTAFDQRMSGMVAGLAVGEVDGRDVVLAGDFGGDVRLYDFGDLSAEVVASGLGPVIGCAIVDGQLVVGTMSGWASYSSTHEVVFEVDTGEQAFSTFSTGTIGAEPVVILGGRPSAAWSLRTGDRILLPAADPGRAYWPTVVTADPSGEIIVGYQNGEVLAFTADGQRQRLACHEEKVSALVLAGQGRTRHLLSAGHDGRVRRTPLGDLAPRAATMNVGEHLDGLVIGSSGWLAAAASGRGGAVLEWSEEPMG